jgi:hypothetical protein
VKVKKRAAICNFQRDDSMKSRVLRLSGMVGRKVSCIAPVVSYPELPKADHPAVGQIGRIIGFIEEKDDFSVFVRMEGEFDHYDVQSRSLDSFFRVVAS